MKKKIVIKFSKGGISDNLIQDTERRQTKHQQLQLRKRKYERDRPHKKPGVNRVKAVTGLLMCLYFGSIHIIQL
jgi:hypothetical protein